MLNRYTSYISTSHTFPNPTARTNLHSKPLKSTKLHPHPSNRITSLPQTHPPSLTITFFSTKLRKHPVDAISLNPLSRITHNDTIRHHITWRHDRTTSEKIPCPSKVVFSLKHRRKAFRCLSLLRIFNNIQQIPILATSCPNARQTVHTEETFVSVASCRRLFLTPLSSLPMQRETDNKQQLLLLPGNENIRQQPATILRDAYQQRKVELNDRESGNISYIAESRYYYLVARHRQGGERVRETGARRLQSRCCTRGVTGRDTLHRRLFAILARGINSREASQNNKRSARFIPSHYLAATVPRADSMRFSKSRAIRCKTDLLRFLWRAKRRVSVFVCP